jgi:acetyl esterase/lipase
MLELWTTDVPLFNATISQERHALEPYLLADDKPHACVIVCPGGGYWVHAPHEAEPVALWFNSLGISSFVLRYRTTPYHHPAPLLDAQRANRTVRARYRDFNVDPRRIGILGFSAGGHLASTAGTHYDEGNRQSPDPIERVSSRPDVMILCGVGLVEDHPTLSLWTKCCSAWLREIGFSC